MADNFSKPELKSANSGSGFLGHDEVAKHDSYIETSKIDLVNNTNAKVVNPLGGKSEAQLRAEVKSFCNQYGFQDEENIFQKGALVAQNPSSFEDLQCLDQDDVTALRREVTHKWHHPLALYCTIGVLSLGAAVQGWDNTGTNGANLTYPVEFGIADRPMLVGVVNSGLTISGCLFAWSNDFFNHYLGRRGVVFLTGLFCIFPILGQAFTQTWQEIFIVRLIAGCALGVKIATIPIYSSEVAPASIRGALTMSFQTFVAAGILLGFCVNLIFNTTRFGNDAWRYQIAAAFVPAVPVCLLCWFCPESPRWLLKKGKHQKAFRSFCRLRNTRLQAARDLYYCWAQVQEEEKAFGGSTYFGRIRDLFVVPRIRRATYATFAVMLAQQLSGINIMAFYSSTIFVNAGWSADRALWASFGFSVVVFCVVPIAWFTIDTFGRRSLLLFGFPLMGISLFLVAAFYSLDASNNARVPLIATFIYIFSALYGVCMGPVPNVVASESFPLSHRETGGAWGIFINNAFSTALGLTFPLLLEKVGGTNAFLFYGGLNILALIIVFFLMPETKQRTLEELDYIYAVPSGKFASYQAKIWLPGMIKKHVFRQKVFIPPLYNLEEVAGGTHYTSVGH